MEGGGVFPPTKGFLNNWDLYSSSKAGDILRVKYLVEQLDVDVNERDEHDSSPLFYACLCGHTDLVKYLLDCGSRLIPGLYETERCFYGALTPDIRDLLREHKADPNKFDHLGQNMQGLRELMLHTDFTLTVTETGDDAPKTRNFNLHRFVLSMRSTWFAEHFTTTWKSETQAAITCADSKIMPSIAVATALLDFLYSSNVDVDETHGDALADSLEALGFDKVARTIRQEVANKERELRSIVIKPEKERQRLTREMGDAFSYSFGGPNDASSQSLDKRAWHDICLEVEDENGSHRYACHRALLCQHSAYFHAMITGRFAEAEMIRSSDAELPVLKMDMISNPRLLRIAIRFLYTNALNEQLESDDTVELLQLSDNLMLMELKRLCAVRLRRSLDSDNVFSFLRLGDTFGVRVLKQAALDYIEQHIADLHTTEEFKQALVELPQDIVHELKLYLEDKLEIVSED